MPITQARMKKLIDAAQAVVATHIGQCATLGELAAKYRAGKLPLEELLEYVEMRGVRPDAAIASELVVINSEMYHWLATHNRNEQEARRLARRRAEARGETYEGEPTRAPVYKPRQAMEKPVVEPEPRVQSNAKELEALPEMDNDLFDVPDYTPGPLSDETKAEIEAAAEFYVKPGYTLPQSICHHQGEAGPICGQCGADITAGE